ncbi:hypothetical protein [Neisseria musculi]|uniref:hypothetical protein n=1 Tax=Neisseria musculi TaxID=1815583 RepID=UPI00164C5FD1|nr:hypothetical protein [Neisseria musculi]
MPEPSEKFRRPFLNGLYYQRGGIYLKIQADWTARPSEKRQQPFLPAGPAAAKGLCAASNPSPAKFRPSETISRFSDGLKFDFQSALAL